MQFHGNLSCVGPCSRGDYKHLNVSVDQILCPVIQRINTKMKVHVIYTMLFYTIKRSSVKKKRDKMRALAPYNTALYNGALSICSCKHHVLYYNHHQIGRSVYRSVGVAERSTMQQRQCVPYTGAGLPLLVDKEKPYNSCLFIDDQSIVGFCTSHSIIEVSLFDTVMLNMFIKNS